MRKNPYCFITRFEDDFHGKEEIKEETMNGQTDIFYSVDGERHGISLTYVDVEKTCLSRITLFRRNVEVGPSWDFSMGHSRPMLAVTINMNKVSGTHIWGGGAIYNNTTWIYPDLSTVLVGNFSENRLVRGREGEIRRVICNNGIMQIETETVASDQTYSFEFDSLNSLGSFPTLQDPFEAKYLKVDSSPWGGEGIFARTNLPSDRLIGYFHGIKIPKDTLYDSWIASDEIKLLSESERSDQFIRRKSYIIALNYEHDIDMPPDIGEDSTK
ncbi:uncharacterized protein LOC111716891 [Eurytemora carolleeae]|uniref:uncharacterized protein LOC111716891 n=1 Tax=Eurytemora carolleeae TaxID=1294199 RepID=UPI000C78BA0B|nr:uncharacterized protein LOC111716891 [Eurytemora carolleeae]|eukprot:XP_023348173.1 uncharacterized protein LOC111716891 [Eurytemora affinis]